MVKNLKILYNLFMKKSNIIISNPKKFAVIKSKITSAGLKKIHVVSDFDRTLTKAFVRGQAVPSLISILRDENYLTPDYPEKAKALFKKYHAIETNPKISYRLKKIKMKEWWQKHFDLLIESGLTIDDIKKAMKSARLQFRPGVTQLLDLLHKKQIPLVIFSSSGLGWEAISRFLKNNKKLYNNIHIVSNAFVWSKTSRALAVKQPIIHGYNKDETTISRLPFFKKIKSRTNVILLGNSPADVGMVKGFKYQNLLKIGFLNEKVKKNLKEYKIYFDVIITNDGPINFVNKLLNKFIKQ